MKVKEINRLFEALENMNYKNSEIADCLNYIVTEKPNFIEDEDAALFEKQMNKFFPDPMSRASIMKRLVISSSIEEPDDEDEGANAKEADFFLQQMLSAIADMFEKADSLEMAKEKLSTIIDRE